MAERQKDNMDVLLAYRLGIADDSVRAEAEQLLAGKDGQSLDKALQRTLQPLGAWQDVDLHVSSACQRRVFVHLLSKDDEMILCVAGNQSSLF